MISEKYTHFWNRIPVDKTKCQRALRAVLLDRKGYYMKNILVIGAGASGMMAALAAAKFGCRVTIYEKSDRIGKKILATGNGKCNLTNLNMGTEFYYTEDEEKLARCLERFSERDTLTFFEELGLMTRERDGYVYPFCEQASVVLDVLRLALDKNGIQVKTSVEQIRIEVLKNGLFQVVSTAGKDRFDAVILACGSKAGIKNVITDGYDLAKNFGHKIKKLYPALVQVRCKEPVFSAIAGVRIKAGVTLLVDGEVNAMESGEVQLTDYGISGIPVFQMSRLIAGFLDENKKITVCLDFLPHLSKDEWKDFYQKRLEDYAGRTAEEFLLGVLHKKISQMLLKEYGLKPADSINDSIKKKLELLCDAMKVFTVTPHSVNPFEQAQVCRGGVDFKELDDSMQSIYQKNLYVCGEMVDIDGKCGGYNLQWAWTSGYLAGSNAAK